MVGANIYDMGCCRLAGEQRSRTRQHFAPSRLTESTLMLSIHLEVPSLSHFAVPVPAFRST